MHVLVAEDFHAQVVESFIGFGVFEEDEFEGGLFNGKIRVSGLALAYFGVEELGIEGDGFFEILDVECELQAHDEELLDSFWASLRARGVLMKAYSGRPGRACDFYPGTPWQQLSVRKPISCFMASKSGR